MRYELNFLPLKKPFSQGSCPPLYFLYCKRQPTQYNAKLIYPQRRGGAISCELAILGISAVLGKAVARHCTYCTASGN